MSKQRIEALKYGSETGCGHKCHFEFNNEKIRCDSKLEYACLQYAVKYLNAKKIMRHKEAIEYKKKDKICRFLPDFIIETQSEKFIVECKYDRAGKYLNKKWGNYLGSAILKKKVLIRHAKENGMRWLWFTNMTWKEGYSELFGKDLK